MPYIGNQPYQGVIDSGNIVDGSIQTGDLANSAVTAAKIADTGVTVAKLNSDVTQLIAQGGGPKITGVAITNSNWTTLDDTAVDTAGGYIKLTGTNFVTGCSVVVGTTSATAVTFTSSTELRIQLPAQAAGTYILYVTNPDGGTAIRVNAVTYSATPSWVTSSTLPQQDDGVAVSIQLSATSATTYALQSGSTLPSGLTLTSGGLLSGTVSGLANDTSYSFTVVATDAELQDSPRAFTVNIAASDPYFNLTTLLINGDTAPNVLTDASSNNFNLIAYGDSRASNFTPYAAGWSVYFDGNSGIYAASNTASQFGTNAFTIEAFVYMTSYSTYSYIIDTRTSGTNGLWLYYYNGAFTTGQTADLAFSNSSISLNTWNHIAFTGTGGNTLELFINGVSKGTITHSYNVTGDKTTIGRRYNPAEAANNWNGYISNVRVTKGVRLYTANFTPETTNLTTSPATLGSGTVSLLTCLGNRLLDLSSTNYTSWTRDGTPRVTTFNPFNITNTGTSGSIYFDGTDDYVTVGTTASNAFAFSGDFTIEAWFYKPGNGSDTYESLLSIGDGNGVNGFFLELDDTRSLAPRLYMNNGALVLDGYVTSKINDAQWHHIACVRSGSNCAMFYDGTRVATSTSSASLVSSASALYIGRASTGSINDFYGYVSDLRIINGTAAYNPTLTNITVPTQPLTAVANTQLLTLQNKQPHNNHSFQDSSTNNHLITRSGNATQGTFSPFSPAGWSLSFTSGNGITVPTSIATSLASSGATFTIEAWVYLNSYGSAPTNQEYYNRAIFGIGNTYGAFLIDSTGKLNLYSYDGTGRFTTSTGTVALRTWTHVAASVTGGVIKLFIDGTLSGTGTWYGHIGGAITTCIGSTSDTNGGTNRHFDGYIASFRLSNIARYNISFNKPTSLYTTDANTVILTGQLNRLVDESNSPQTLTNVSASIQAYSPFKPTAAYSPTTHGGSVYLDGSDTLTFSREAVNNLSTNNFTWECWVYRTAVNDTTYADAICCSVTNYTGLAAGIDPAGKVGYAIGNTAAGNNWNIRLGVDPGNPKGSITVPLNSWTHIALVRNGSQFVGFVNGAVDQSFTSADGIGNIGSDYYIGRWHDSYNRFWIGYISNIRLIRGINLYSTASTTNGTQVFSPPTAPFTSTKETSYLFNFTDAAARDSTGRLVLETVGDSKVSVVQKKYGTGAMYFDGTGDYLYRSDTVLNQLGTGDYTIEFWLYPNSFSNTPVLLEYGRQVVAGTPGLELFIATTSGRLDVYGGPTINTLLFSTTSTNIATGAWTHIALTRASGTTRLYFNGTQPTGSSVSDTTNYTQANIWIGAYIGGTASLNGYIDDLRITKYARYTTTNFTPPAQTFKLR